MFKPTLYEETHPSSVDFLISLDIARTIISLQRYNKKMTHANFCAIFCEISKYPPVFILPAAAV